MLTGPFPPWPNYSDEEVAAVTRVLQSNKVNYWTGEEGRLFEKEFALFADSKHAIAVANGTVAIDLILNGLGIGSHNGGHESDEVIVTPRSFMASVSAIVNAGARPIFADVDLESQNISPATAEPCLSARTRAIICVHLAGWPCDMDGFSSLVSERDIFLIEDCAQAHGALYKGRPVGGLGDAAAWSFCQDKIMTTGGEGGMVTCNDENLWKKMWAYKDHGKSWDAVYNREHPNGFRWLHEGFGTNFRLTEMQSTIGRIQLKKMTEWQAVRSKNAANLKDALSQFSGEEGFIRIPRHECFPGNDNHEGMGCCRHAWYKYYAFVRPENLSRDYCRDQIIEQFNEQGLPCLTGSCSEIYLEKAFEGTGLRPENFLPNARKLGRTSLMFLVHPGVTPIELKHF